MEAKLGLSNGDAEYGASSRLAPRAHAITSLWVR
jgi:hypothetical protein